jgi:aspartyl-tRNA(Asn)/glutamyl-tRNA(Gln) amidotransferase subunit B
LKVTIGLEIHVQMSEAGSKLFCNCKADYRGLNVNTNVCPVCLGLPGALPVVSKRSVELALATSLALKCEIPKFIVFTRKHYFYPDLPKNYQISMIERAGGVPICRNGVISFLDPSRWEWKSCRIRRVNIEEDPGRTVYEEGGITGSPYALVDYNRSGVPLLEIVTEPDIETPRDARLLVEYLLLTLEYLGVTNPRLEGVFRVDANISLDGGERVEVKNIGSIADVEKALNYEILRQSKIREAGGVIERETRHWDPVRGVTRPLRHKEYEEEYLYFPDPDLPPIAITEEMVKGALKIAVEADLQALLSELLKHNIPPEHAWSIVSTKPALDLFKKVVSLGGDPQVVARMLAVDYKGELREQGKDPYDPSNWPPPDTILELSKLTLTGVYPYDTIKGLIIPNLVSNPLARLETLIPEKAGDLDLVVEEVLREEVKAVKDYLEGKTQALNYLVGRVIKKIGRKAVDPRIIRGLLEKRIKAGAPRT